MANVYPASQQAESSLQDEKPQGQPAAQADHHHEGLGLNLRVIFSVSAILLVLAVLIHLTIWWMMNHFAATPQKPVTSLSPLASLPGTPPPPRQQIAPALDEQALHAIEDNALHSYGWVDKPAGIVHIPVERAKDLILQQGMPATEKQP